MLWSIRDKTSHYRSSLTSSASNLINWSPPILPQDTNSHLAPHILNITLMLSISIRGYKVIECPLDSCTLFTLNHVYPGVYGALYIPKTTVQLVLIPLTSNSLHRFIMFLFSSDSISVLLFICLCFSFMLIDRLLLQHHNTKTSSFFSVKPILFSCIWSYNATILLHLSHLTKGNVYTLCHVVWLVSCIFGAGYVCYCPLNKENKLKNRTMLKLIFPLFSLD